ncbi:MAG: AmmeMemoRadiSam system protein B [Solidesulfovibrio sp. DCME]|uniref:AmmeMemoRadiSam system protein B n=1 Tax=Solidesulfovibrio sp. DCME TaxID=3447380 RepID=UPI003D09B84C
MNRQVVSPETDWVRGPVVAGRFYPAAAASLRREVAAFLAAADPNLAGPAKLAMVPHAGYVYSGAVAGRTLGAAGLPDTLLLLGPNHTGRGARLAVWGQGSWRIPGGEVPVATELAGELCRADPGLVPDTAAHLAEHSLEVVLPFLWVKNPAVRVVPVAVAEPDPRVLARVGAAVAAVLGRRAEAVGIVVSSDMSHYVPHEAAKRRDALALSRILALDPEGLVRVVREEGITMCGVLPMALGLIIAKALGAREAVLAAYATSGEVSGDMDQVVGYAGVIVR